jgi:hypothetical protein
MTDPNWYRRSYRRNLVDIHIEDWDPAFMSEFDPEQYFSLLQTAQVQSAMIYLQSHVGHCNWDSASGHTHASFTDCTRKMQRLFDLCHDAGMDVIAYYSLIYNNVAYVEHPEWRLRDIHGHSTRFDHGKGQYFGGSRYGLCCPNNLEYRAFVMAQLDEMFDRFVFEGIFLDMTFWTRVCYCDACKARWQQEQGGEMPTRVDWQEPRWRALQFKREEWMGDFCRQVTAKIKSRNPNCSVEHQYSTMMHNWRQGVNHNIAENSDYCGGDFYGGISQHSIACKLYYNMTLNQPFEYMTSRCYPGLREHTTTKSYDMLAQSVMATFMHHGAALLIDAIDPKGSLDPSIYECYGRIYGEARKYEKYMEGEMVQDVGVLFNLEAKYNPAPGKAEEGSMPHPDAAVGASRYLQRAHVPYGVFGNWRPEKMTGAKVLVLGDAYDMSAELVKTVTDYVARGGRVYMSGRVNPELVEELLGVRPDGELGGSMTYMVPTAAGQTLFADHNHDYPLAYAAPMQCLAHAGSAQVLATVALPYQAPALTRPPQPDASDGFDYESPEARFASIHSNPPGRYVDNPSLLYGHYGEGRVVYSAAAFEAHDRPANGAVLVKILDLLTEDLDGWSFSAEAPSQVEIVQFTVAEKKRHYVNLINSLDAFELATLCDITVRVRVPGKVKRVLALPEEKALPFDEQNAVVEFAVERLKICRSFAVDWE